MRAQRAIATWLGLAVLLAGRAAEALAAAPKAKGGAPGLDESLSFWPILVTIVALLGICVVAFKNAHRTHLD